MINESPAVIDLPMAVEKFSGFVILPLAVEEPVGDT